MHLKNNLEFAKKIQVTMDEKVSRVLKAEFARNALDLDESEIEYLSSVLAELLTEKSRVAASRTTVKELFDDIIDVISPTLSEYVKDDVESIIDTIAKAVVELVYSDARAFLVDPKLENGSTPELPLLDFPDLSLAYMGLELLRHTSLQIYRGKIYGIVGRNGIGKTTLLNKLAIGEVPGFPKSLKSGIVRHELIGKDQITPREIIKDASILSMIGFDDEHASLADIPCSDLSGGWRMRVSIGLTISDPNLDILLLDEPTNHLDRECVEWLISFLKCLNKVAVIFVSHDQEFIDRTINYLIYYNNYKLKVMEFIGFKEFVKTEKLDPNTLIPLSEGETTPHNVLPFILPKPGPLDGIKTSTQTIAKLDNVSFTYPQTGRKRVCGVSDISGRVTLSSRIALVGKNGAGKSTIASLLVGQLSPDSGSVFRHANLRIAFVSQHHVHHLEEFLDKTCLDYFVDRFSTGVDKEIMNLESVTESNYEQLDRIAKAKKFVNKCGGRSMPGGVEALVGRRKEGKEYAYEVKWASYTADKTDWLPRSVLETELGVGKLCSALDAIIAQKKSGTDQRALDFNSIKAYLKQFGLLAQTVEGKISGLSGGQKSRLTLAASMWVHPHLLILDEPTNYLDMSSLDALLDAVANFHGGVVVISHNAPFVDRFAKEKWIIDHGRRVDHTEDDC